FEDALYGIGRMKEHGLDFADLSLGLNTNALNAVPFADVAFMVERGARMKRDLGLPVGVSWNLGDPRVAERVIREGLIDVVFLGRPALANPHWPVWAARELGLDDPFALVPEDWAWWLRNLRGHPSSLGWPQPAEVGGA
ncbi:MAG: hypothetical protein ACREEQ_15150, partial [Caulobacteraceae bacterium]